MVPMVADRVQGVRAEEAWRDPPLVFDHHRTFRGFDRRSGGSDLAISDDEGAVFNGLAMAEEQVISPDNDHVRVGDRGREEEG